MDYRGFLGISLRASSSAGIWGGVRIRAGETVLGNPQMGLIRLGCAREKSGLSAQVSGGFEHSSSVFQGVGFRTLHEFP